MRTLIRHLLYHKGLPGLVASAWGFCFGEAVLLGVTATICIVLGVGTLVSEIVTGVVAIATLPFLLMVIKHEWDEPQVKSLGMFLAVFVTAIIFSALMPIVIAWAIAKTYEEVSVKRAKVSARSYRVSTRGKSSGLEYISSQVEGTYRRRISFIHMRYGI
jgi:hypothetical protein